MPTNNDTPEVSRSSAVAPGASPPSQTHTGGRGFSFEPEATAADLAEMAEHYYKQLLDDLHAECGLTVEALSPAEREILHHLERSK